MLININLLPEEVMLNILSFFKPNELNFVTCINKDWHRLADDNQIWKGFLKNTANSSDKIYKKMFFSQPADRKEIYLTCDNEGIDWILKNNLQELNLDRNTNDETRERIKNSLTSKAVRFFLKKGQLALVEIKQLTQDLIDFLRYPTIETLVVNNKLSFNQAVLFVSDRKATMHLFNNEICKYIMKGSLTYEQAFQLTNAELSLLKVDYIQKLLDSNKLPIEQFLSLKNACSPGKSELQLLKLVHKPIHQLHSNNKISLTKAFELDFPTLIKLNRYPRLTELICSDKISLDKIPELTDEAIVNLLDSQVEIKFLSK